MRLTCAYCEAPSSAGARLACWARVQLVLSPSQSTQAATALAEAARSPPIRRHRTRRRSQVTALLATRGQQLVHRAHASQRAGHGHQAARSYAQAAPSTGTRRTSLALPSAGYGRRRRRTAALALCDPSPHLSAATAPALRSRAQACKTWLGVRLAPGCPLYYSLASVTLLLGALCL